MNGTGIHLNGTLSNERLSADSATHIRSSAKACPKFEAFDGWGDSVTVMRAPLDNDITLKLVNGIPTRDWQGSVFPSSAFVRATLRRLGGPCQPGPGRGMFGGKVESPPNF